MVIAVNDGLTPLHALIFCVAGAAIYAAGARRASCKSITRAASLVIRQIEQQKKRRAITAIEAQPFY